MEDWLLNQTSRIRSGVPFYDLCVRWCSQRHPRQTLDFLWLPSKIRSYSRINEDIYWSGYLQDTGKTWENWSRKILLLTRSHSARRCNAGCWGKKTPSLTQIWTPLTSVRLCQGRHIMVWQIVLWIWVLL